MRLAAHGFAVDLPERWEGAVQVGAASPSARSRAAGRGIAVRTPAALHLSTAALPPVRGDFGSGAVDLLGDDDAFVAVVAYGPESLGTALFASGGMPRRLDPRAFAPNGLQRPLPGQSGLQVFCTEGGLPLSLYVVLGAHRNARRLVRRVEEVLAAVEVGGP